MVRLFIYFVSYAMLINNHMNATFRAISQASGKWSGYLDEDSRYSQ